MLNKVIKRIAVSWVLLACVLQFSTSYVWANGMPANFRSDLNGNIFPMPIYDEDLEIQKENLTFSNFRSPHDTEILAKIFEFMFPTVAYEMDVNVRYEMYNTSSNSKTVNIVFPIHNLPAIGGNPGIVVTRGNENEYLGYRITDGSPWSAYDIQIDYEKEKYRGHPESFDSLEFSLGFAPYEKLTLSLSFVQHGGYDKRTKHFIYLLQPAKFWKDFRDLDISIEMPSNYSFSSPMGFMKYSGGLRKNDFYYAHFNTLPDMDVVFEARWIRREFQSLVFLGIIAAIIAFVIARRIIRKNKKAEADRKP